MNSAAAMSLERALGFAPPRNMRLTARWVFPVSAPPIENGVIEVVDGRIADVSQLRGAADDRTLDLGPVALLAGLVNCHAHLEFSDLAAPLGEPAAFVEGAAEYPFADWIGQVVAHRRNRVTPLPDLVRNGLREATNSGTTAVGEIATGDWSPEFVDAASPRVVAFRESLCFLPEQVMPQLALAREHLTRCRTTSGRMIGALSPHAPYTVLPELFDSLIQLAADERVPLCTHLAETRAELEFLMHGTGALRDMLSRIELWRDGLHPTGRRPLDFLKSLARLEHSLIAHGNYLDQDECRFLAEHPQISVIYCPRTHHYFGHAPHPWRELLASGASVALGTDGRSSNPDYSLWNEVLWLDRLTAGRERPLLLELATIRGAQALGLATETGSLSAGKAADLCVVPLTPGAESDPFMSLYGQPHAG